MMHRRGHTVYHYGHEDSQVECTEHITVVSRDTFNRTYGHHDWKKNFYSWDTNDAVHKEYNENCIREITKRKQRGDFLLCFFDQQAVGQPFINGGEMICCNPGIGNTNPLWLPYNIFESQSVMNCIYHLEDPRLKDCVIPNYFDTRDFTYQAKKKDYLLFIGRLIKKKGLDIAEDVALRTGHKLIVAGQGTYKNATGRDTPPSCVEMFGVATVEQRRELLANAKALIAPTYYMEPTGGVTLEAGFAGTPVITTDWGGFSENTLHGITGYRCRTMESFCWAVKNIHLIKPEACRAWAVKNFSMPVIALKYECYFHSIRNVTRGKNFFYDENPERTELDWMKRYYPQTYTQPSPVKQKVAEKNNQKEENQKDKAHQITICPSSLVDANPIACSTLKHVQEIEKVATKPQQEIKPKYTRRNPPPPPPLPLKLLPPDHSICLDRKP